MKFDVIVIFSNYSAKKRKKNAPKRVLSEHFVSDKRSRLRASKTPFKAFKLLWSEITA